VTAPYSPSKITPIAPAASSTYAYARSGRFTFSERCPTKYAPRDIPPRKMTSTMICAYALWPTKSPRYRLQMDS
jgi:hypothetical protein